MYYPTTYKQSFVEETLCFGWIDSLVRRLDEERYMQKFTPRKMKSTWSKHNVRRMEKMITDGKMTSSGMKLYIYAKENDLLPAIDDKKEYAGILPEIPDYFIRALKRTPEAEKAFFSLAPSYKLRYPGWIMDAKKEKTRLKRMKETIELLISGKKLGMK